MCRNSVSGTSVAILEDFTYMQNVKVSCVVAKCAGYGSWTDPHGILVRDRYMLEGTSNSGKVSECDLIFKVHAAYTASHTYSSSFLPPCATPSIALLSPSSLGPPFSYILHRKSIHTRPTSCTVHDLFFKTKTHHIPSSLKITQIP
ncbi:hypothetical protein CLIB1423_17S02432 [[Candida] railenensis]|uniref:Uncharacterized protein n=1 Tax=[Candida] railenensis TaxID=45579 RepID=A0A9P0QTE8_9ASCO|nr:hypothetical protein CLIB1423_17S02432 [[Candida] railenensis]